MRVNVSSWAKRNLAADSNGGYCVRPAIQSRLALTGVHYGFSVRDEFSDTVWHYLVYTDTGVTYVAMYDDRMDLVYRVEWGNVEPNYVTHAVVANQVLVAAGNLPTLWSYTGMILEEERPLAWDDQPALDPLEIPRGMVHEWAGRAVYSDGGLLYFSEGGEPRMLFADNIQNPPGGRVVGMHTMKSGALLLSTVTGTYALDRQAATSGEFILGVWQKVNDHQASHVGSTVSAHGRVWGSSRNGVRLIDTDSQFEAELNDPDVPMSLADPVKVADFKPELRLFEGEHGLVAACPSIDKNCMNFASERTWSWWDCPVVVGQLRTQDGEWLLATEDGIYSVEGTNETGVTGFFIGRVPTPPIKSAVVREIHVSSDTSGNVVAAVLGEDKSEAAPQPEPTWGTAVYGTSEWRAPEMRSRRFRFARRTDDIAIEAGATGCGSRVDTAVDVEIRGVGKKRVTN